MWLMKENLLLWWEETLRCEERASSMWESECKYPRCSAHSAKRDISRACLLNDISRSHIAGSIFGYVYWSKAQQTESNPPQLKSLSYVKSDKFLLLNIIPNENIKGENQKHTSVSRTKSRLSINWNFFAPTKEKARCVKITFLCYR